MALAGCSSTNDKSDPLSDKKASGDSVVVGSNNFSGRDVASPTTRHGQYSFAQRDGVGTVADPDADGNPRP